MSEENGSIRRLRQLAGTRAPLLGLAVLGMIVTFGAGWALGGASETDPEVGLGTSEPRTQPAPTVPHGTAGSGHAGDGATVLPAQPGTEGIRAPQPFAAPLPNPARPPKPPVKAFSCPKPTVRVTTADGLTAALAAARPGDSIALAEGVYVGEFKAVLRGTAKKPVYLCGPREAVLDGGGIKGGYALHLDGASWWRVKGFTVRNGQKGIMLDGVTGVGLQGLRVDQIGDEAVHLRRHSRRNVVRGLTIGVTGLRRPKFGEGVYIGTAESNWCTYTGCQQDHSDGNFVLDNVFTATSSEAVDIKEGTNAGVVSGNRFDGASIRGADSWVDVKGNGWLITNNTGVRAPYDGYQVHEIVDGYGYRNLFSKNVSKVDAPGLAFKVTKTRSGNVVTCSNRASGAREGLTNIPCR